MIVLDRDITSDVPGNSEPSNPTGIYIALFDGFAVPSGGDFVDRSQLSVAGISSD